MWNIEALESEIYEVLLNQEEQYALWLKDRPIPQGWKKVGKQGSKVDCMAYIDEVWVDMRPLSLRKEMVP